MSRAGSGSSHDKKSDKQKINMKPAVCVYILSFLPVDQRANGLSVHKSLTHGMTNRLPLMYVKEAFAGFKPMGTDSPAAYKGLFAQFVKYFRRHEGRMDNLQLMIRLGHIERFFDPAVNLKITDLLGDPDYLGRKRAKLLYLLRDIRPGWFSDLKSLPAMAAEGGYSPLHQQALYGQRDAVARSIRWFSLETLSDADNEGGFTVLHMAAIGGDILIANMIINRLQKAGGDVDMVTKKDRNGILPLGYAVDFHHADMVRQLLTYHGSDVTIDIYEEFCRAIRLGLNDVVQAFIECCDIAVDAVKFDFDKTPIDMAKEKGFSEITSRLEAYAHGVVEEKAGSPTPGGRP